MAARKYTELIVWQLAEELKMQAFSLLDSSQRAKHNFRYVKQLETAAEGAPKHITEGFLRFAPLEFAKFLDYAISSVGETEGWLRDGITRGYFPASDCARSFSLAKRLSKGIIRLKASQLRYAKELEARKREEKNRARSNRSRTRNEDEEN